MYAVVLMSICMGISPKIADKCQNVQDKEECNTKKLYLMVIE
jgi:hypothetical protein